MCICVGNDQQKARIWPIPGLLFLSTICILFCCGLLSCQKGTLPFDPFAGKYHYVVPGQTGDGWETASLSSVGMDYTYFERLMNSLYYIKDHNLHSLLVVKDGKLVFEEYFPGQKFCLAEYTGEMGFDRDDTHTLCSATKSIVSALFGIAIDKGFVDSMEEKVFDFFPEYSDLLVAVDEKRELTIKHLLTMTSGIDWDDETFPYTDPRNDIYQLFTVNDPMRYILKQPLSTTPGTVFDYDNCNTNVLGEIIHKASDFTLDEFSEIYLFSKLGIVDFEWQHLSNNVVFASGDLLLRPRDMAKFGTLFLNEGVWNGEQIISQDWIDVSTQKYLNPNQYSNEYTWADGYGYQWWQWEGVNGTGFSSYLAAGWGGQWIIINPAMNLVLVSTAGNYYSAEKVPIKNIISEYILPSIAVVESEITR
jgi:CubicO group peptidase (beta-lactamase class C family)